MATLNCVACEAIREIDPSLVSDGWTDTECASFANNTGLSPSSGNDDATDLEYMNDCLLGNLEVELDGYDVCDWKTFMGRLLPNLWTLFSANKCAIGGLWENINSSNPSSSSTAPHSVVTADIPIESLAVNDSTVYAINLTAQNGLSPTGVLGYSFDVTSGLVSHLSLYRMDVDDSGNLRVGIANNDTDVAFVGTLHVKVLYM